MTVPAFCPHCGADIKPDQPISLNEFAMYGDGYPLFYLGKSIPLSPTQSAICWSLLKAYPAGVTQDALIVRAGLDCESNVIEVQIARIRAKLKKVGAPNPIATQWGRGYCWSLTDVPVRSYGGGRPKKGAAEAAPETSSVRSA